MSTSTQPLTSQCTQLVIGLSIVTLFLISSPAAAYYNQHNLVTDDQQNLVTSGYKAADFIDPDLKNPWGIVSSSTGPFWVSDNATGLSSLYNGSGVKQGLLVTITGGSPTGTVFNGGPNFQITPAPARFIFASETGKISGWNSGSQTNTIVKVDNSASGAIYKGLAIDSSTAGTLLYAANFGNGTIDIFDANFSPVFAVGAFQDPNLPQGVSPFNIQNLGGELYVTYAFKAPGASDETVGAGLGIVDVFNTQGSLIRRLISTGSVLDAPWALAMAPSDFGEFSGDLLVGNFGDGKINAFDPLTGIYKGTLSNAKGDPIVIDGLWGLSFGNGTNAGDTDTLYFTAGISDEAHGLFGSLSAIPEPTALPIMVLGLILASSNMRRLAYQRR